MFDYRAVEGIVEVVVGVQLEAPLRRVAELAVRRRTTAQHQNDPSVDFFPLRRYIGPFCAGLIVDFLRKEVEAATSQRETVRLAGGDLEKGHVLFAVVCVICPFDTPEGVLTSTTPDMYVFDVAGTTPGYHAG